MLVLLEGHLKNAWKLELLCKSDSDSESNSNSDSDSESESESELRLDLPTCLMWCSFNIRSSAMQCR